MRSSGQIIPHISRVPGGYNYWTSIRTRYGWRQLGKEWFCVVDDFGFLVAIAVTGK